MAKIDIISGFLGAGKTTLIQKLLKEALKGEKVVLIENEFGEIGIDGGFLKDAGIEVTEMNSGCICCSLVGDFGSALKEVVTQYDPDRIIIEPSGVGKLSDVIKAVQGVAEDVDLDLNSFVTVADAKKCKMYIKNFGEFYNNQVEYAGSIILSRTGDVAEDKLNESVALLREHNEKAAIITTPWDELSGEQILKVMEDGNDMAKELLEEEEICPVCGGHHDHEHEHEHHHHDHDEECGCGHDHDHEHEHHHHDHDEECGCGCGHDHEHHHHGEFDPHIWMSPKQARIQMKNVYEAIVKFDSENKDFYEKNYKELDKKFEELDKKYAEVLAPQKDKYFIVPHEAFGYLARDYEIKQVPIEGINSDSEPDLNKMKELTNFAKSHKINTVFYEMGESDKIANSLAKEINAKTAGLSTIEAKTQDIEDGKDNYFSLLEKNLDAISQAK